MVEVYLVQGRSGITTNDFLAVKVCPNIIELCLHRLLIVLLQYLVSDVIQSCFICMLLLGWAVTDDLLLGEVCHGVQSG